MPITETHVIISVIFIWIIYVRIYWIYDIRRELLFKLLSYRFELILTQQYSKFSDIAEIDQVFKSVFICVLEFWNWKKINILKKEYTFLYKDMYEKV
jgi:hypothetical protein